MHVFGPQKTPQRTPDGQSRGVFRSLLFWREASQWSVIGFVAVVAVAVWVIVLCTGWVSDWRNHVKAPRNGAAAPVTEPVAAPEEPMRRRAIDGVFMPVMPVDPDAAGGAATEPEPQRHYSVMIDNLWEARPSSGVAGASVVYEAPVEGGITRLLAVFPDDAAVAKIGPVRSARPYFLDWAAEYDALYGHVGGSPEALEKLAAYGMADLNEFFAGQYFWRDKARYAPHNTYTSTERLAEAFAKRYGDRDRKPLAAWKFKEDAPLTERPEQQTVKIDYGGSRVNVSWTYDQAENGYVRRQDGAARDADGTPITAKNVIVQETAVAVIDAVGRRRITTVGKGDAVIIRDGLAIHGTWSKESRTGRTRFYDASRNEVELNAGTTWVEIVPVGTPVTEE